MTGFNLFSLLIAQDFRYEWEIESPQQAGYHRIQLPVFVNCECKSDLADLRLYEVGGSTEIPFLLEQVPGEVLSVYPTQFTVADNPELKYTEAKVSLKCPAPLHRMVIKVSSPGKFYRQAQLTEKNESKEGVHLIAESWLEKTENVVVLPKRTYNSELTLKIFNEDNQPLQIDTLLFKTDGYQLLAELDPGKQYLIRFGNPYKSAPQYDLRFYRDEIKVLDEVLRVTGEANSLVETTPAPPITEKAEIPTEVEWYQNPMVIWGVLGLVVVLLGLMTWRMLKKA